MSGLKYSFLQHTNLQGCPLSSAVVSAGKSKTGIHRQEEQSLQASRWLCFLSSGFGPEGNDGTRFYIIHINTLQFVNVSTSLYGEMYKEPTLVDGWSQYAMLVSMVTHSRGKELYLCSDSSFLTVSIFHCHKQQDVLSNSNSQRFIKIIV